MKAFGYLIATAPLLHGTLSQILPLKQPAPNSALGNGWRYKGCYSDIAIGLPLPHALGSGSFMTQTPNGGVSCTAYCQGLGYAYAGTNDDQCWCDSGINRSFSLTSGILSPIGNAACQTGCRGNTGEACGSVNTFISIYQYTVSGFLRNACVLAFLLLCFLYLFEGSVERPSARRRMNVEKERVKEAEHAGRGTGTGRLLEALMSSPQLLDPPALFSASNTPQILQTQPNLHKRRCIPIRPSGWLS
ncbi:uncharacterized protein EKO05_0009372 [Ascochyta rabiei]|uniref:uncharacterized protein n=1 Tax=Didymella rabiei TaxID=5454 RepID=UPI00220D3B79|nr:uncharacterized protein EKO05_0009372 [Ascochyta rabiei]UPX19099.1 hypothetical protein EKO05_0009372 [Ascochyta rabiei]